MRDYIERLRTKPEHERRRIALGASLSLTALVCAGYVIALVSSGTLAFESASSEGLDIRTAVEGAGDDFSSFAGAAAALERGFQEGEIQVIETRASSTFPAGEVLDNRTVIPF
ncbi:hypothetical protein L0Y34_02150 [Candidatus Parcubacteria bacterium]|nr:hypothetical protein [Candidatus Parcubacteria bacterium]